MAFQFQNSYKDLVFQVSQAPLITDVEEVHEVDGDGEGNNKPRRWSQVSQLAFFLILISWYFDERANFTKLATVHGQL